MTLIQKGFFSSRHLIVLSKFNNIVFPKNAQVDLQYGIHYINNHILKRTYTSRRAVLYVPGSDIRKIAKVANVKADCIVLDCEDGVAASKKHEARKNILETLTNKHHFFDGKDCCVRINGLNTDLYEQDLSAVLSGPNLPDTLFLPKVESTEHLITFSKTLSKYIEDKLKLVIYVESAHSLLNLPSICAKGVELSQEAPFTLEGVVFGSDDFCADIGATRSKEATETLFARQWTVTSAKAYNLQAIDLVYIDYKDADGLRRQSIEGANMGFTGKQVIHPNQIEIVQEAFSPSEEKVQWAKGLVEAFKKHQSEGKGAFNYGGKMIDRPLLLQAQNIIEIFNNIKGDS